MERSDGIGLALTTNGKRALPRHLLGGQLSNINRLSAAMMKIK